MEKIKREMSEEKERYRTEVSEMLKEIKDIWTLGQILNFVRRMKREG